jgi:hypothetical protein
MAASPDRSSKKNVSGTIKATAMVAVNPGIALTNNPYRAAIKTAKRTCGCNVFSRATQYASVMRNSLPVQKLQPDARAR